ncbi:MAG: hypothetical protein LBP28_05630 [Coriobacteriales bacterium]|jgi:hypothetical protein|nr:hypothetical protein [Coriobacteriales bacterium]
MADSTTEQEPNAADSTTTQAAEGQDPAPEGAGADGQDFMPITSQEEFDKVFNRRWAKEQAKYDALKTKVAGYDALKERATAAEAKLKKYEQDAELEKQKQEIATEYGVDVRLLHGTTEAELKACAETAKEVIGSTTTPVVGTDGAAGGSEASGDLRDFAKSLFST